MWKIFKALNGKQNYSVKTELFQPSERDDNLLKTEQQEFQLRVVTLSISVSFSEKPSSNVNTKKRNEHKGFYIFYFTEKFRKN